jgi:hypothetical protein
MDPQFTLGTPPASRRRRTYRNPAAAMLLTVWIAVIAYFVFFLVLVTRGSRYPLRPEDYLNIGLAAFVLGLIGLGLHLPPVLVHLDITPDEIVYYGLGYTIRAPWTAVTGTGVMWVGQQRIRGLVLHAPAVTVRPWLTSMLRLPLARAYLARLNRYPLPMLEGNEDYRRFVPVDLFVLRRQRAASSDAWDAVEIAAPQLFRRAGTDTRHLAR